MSELSGGNDNNKQEKEGRWEEKMALVSSEGEIVRAFLLNLPLEL